jgi:hypothetical protein
MQATSSTDISIRIPPFVKGRSGRIFFTLRTEHSSGAGT